MIVCVLQPLKGRYIIPRNIVKIGERAFEYSAINVLIHKNVNYIGEGAFTGAVAVTLQKNNRYFRRGVRGELIANKGSVLLYAPDKLPANYRVPYGVKVIGSAALCNKMAIQTVSMPESVVKINSRAFAGCRNLQEITFPDSLCEIGSCSFISCSALRDIKFPNGLKKIDTMAFYGCSKLKNIFIPDSVQELHISAFRNIALEKISVPAHLKNSCDQKSMGGKCEITVRK
jgi:hypothetical protein